MAEDKKNVNNDALDDDADFITLEFENGAGTQPMAGLPTAAK